jgi:hypothetical protein
MSRYLGAALAGVLLFASAGCTIDSFLSPSAVVYGPKTVVTGSASQIAAKLQDGLSDAGMQMYPLKHAGADLRVAGIKNSSLVFCLHLSEKHVPGGRKTLVRMQWDRGGDDELWQTVLKILASPAASDNDSSAAVSDASQLRR